MLIVQHLWQVEPVNGADGRGEHQLERAHGHKSEVAVLDHDGCHHHELSESCEEVTTDQECLEWVASRKVETQEAPNSRANAKNLSSEVSFNLVALRNFLVKLCDDPHRIHVE